MSEFNLNDDIQTKEEAEILLENRKWYHRRGMAYKALYCIFAIIVLTFGSFFFYTEHINLFSSIENVIITALVGLVSIVGFYFGATTYFDYKKGQK